ncbi:MAG: hypothetical protein GC168_15775 [Candidatus Hydrogenedens sp.]|nr:hypothetical protein [Candidatus Hydrogenedens sp.]
MIRFARYLWKIKWRALGFVLLLALLYAAVVWGSYFWVGHRLQHELDTLEAQGIPTTIPSYRAKLEAESGLHYDDSTMATSFLMDLEPDDFNVPPAMLRKDCECDCLPKRFGIPRVFDDLDTHRTTLIDLWDKNAPLIERLDVFSELRNPSALPPFNATFPETWEFPEVPLRLDSTAIDLLLLGITGGFFAAEQAPPGADTEVFLHRAATLQRLIEVFPEPPTDSSRYTLANLVHWQLMHGALSPIALAEYDDSINRRHPLDRLYQKTYRHLLVYASGFKEEMVAFPKSLPEMLGGLLPENVALSIDLQYSDTRVVRDYPNFIDTQAVDAPHAFAYVEHELDAMHERNRLFYDAWGRTVTIDLMDTLLSAGIHDDTVISAREQAVLLLAHLRAHEARHDTFPESLEALDLEGLGPLPLNPFTGAPFAYTRDAAGAHVSWEAPPRMGRGESKPTTLDLPSL